MTTVTTRVDTIVSDLFFMVDNKDYWRTLENGSKEEADNILHQSASDFCYLVEKLGQDYTPEEIIEDYLNRV